MTPLLHGSPNETKAIMTMNMRVIGWMTDSRRKRTHAMTTEKIPRPGLSEMIIRGRDMPLLLLEKGKEGMMTKGAGLLKGEGKEIGLGL